MDILKLMRTVSHSFDSMFSITRTSIVSEYTDYVQSIDLDNTIILDTGTGNELHYNIRDRANLIMMDYDAHSLQDNDYNGYKIAADISSIPLKNSTVNCCTSCFLIEHLPRPGEMIDEISRVLKRGGITVMLFASRNALFSILARILPEPIKELLLKLRDNPHKHGYNTYYRYCEFTDMSQLLSDKGFELEHSSVNYFSAPYFDFCPPLYFFVLVWESLLQILDMNKLASYVLIIAEKN